MAVIAVKVPHAQAVRTGRVRAGEAPVEALEALGDVERRVQVALVLDQLLQALAREVAARHRTAPRHRRRRVVVLHAQRRTHLREQLGEQLLHAAFGADARRAQTGAQ